MPSKQFEYESSDDEKEIMRRNWKKNISEIEKVVTDNKMIL